MEFEYGSNIYRTQKTADEIYSSDVCIVLPDNTWLRVGSWLESMPPKPRDLYEVKAVNRLTTSFIAAEFVGEA